MRKIIYIFIALFFILTLDTHASEKDTILTFKKSIDSLLVTFRANPSGLKISKQLGGRKIKVKGTFDNGTKYFIQKIKYSAGFKKESLLVKHVREKKNKLMFVKVVIINGDYFYLQKYNYSPLDQAIVWKLSKETYVAEGIYKRSNYDVNKKKIKTFYFWNLLTPSERK